MSKILKTNDYSIFKPTWNRPILQSHVNNLVDEFKHDRDSLLKCPIRTSNDLTIVDGQHRLQAMINLHYPVYYIVDETLKTKKEIKKAIKVSNVNQLQWKLSDYIYTEADVKDKKEDYIFLQGLIDRYKDCFSYSSIIFLCQMPRKGNESRAKIIKRGDLSIQNKKELVEFLDKYSNDFRSLTIEYEQKKILKNRHIMKALMNIYFNPISRASYDIFIQNVRKFYKSLAQADNDEHGMSIVCYICHKKGKS